MNAPQFGPPASNRPLAGSDPAGPESLSLDDLRNLQRSLERRLRGRDPSNILAVGFGPKTIGGETVERFSVRVLVRHKTGRRSQSQRVQRVEPVRLLDHDARRYRTLELTTDIVQAARPRPVGVPVLDGDRAATTAAVIRWTTRTPPPPPPTGERIHDPRWRWGLMTVAHLFRGIAPAGRSAAEASRHLTRVRRPESCGSGPETIRGSLVAAGRLPGGPDAAVIETGLDRLWLGGFLPAPDAEPLQMATERDLLRWLHQGASGYLHGPGSLARWRFATYLPAQSIPGLGRLRHIVQFTADPRHDHPQPFGPGSSGAMLVTAGTPLGMQVAAESPHFRTGYAQWFPAVQPWVAQSLRATQLAVVRIL